MVPWAFGAFGIQTNANIYIYIYTWCLGHFGALGIQTNATHARKPLRAEWAAAWAIERPGTRCRAQRRWLIRLQVDWFVCKLTDFKLTDDWFCSPSHIEHRKMANIMNLWYPIPMTRSNHNPARSMSQRQTILKEYVARLAQSNLMRNCLRHQGAISGKDHGKITPPCGLDLRVHL
jgi:hypothetical protein